MTRGRDAVVEADGIVVKRHGGEDGLVRALTAAIAMAAASSSGLPVPRVETVDGVELHTTVVPHAASGVRQLQRDPARLLRSIGSFARALHALPPPDGLPDAASGGTWVHGDLCPVNVLVDDRGEVAAVVDWEDSHVGDAVVDLAWTEWLVRALHPSAVRSLPVLYAAYGEAPDDDRRRAAMRDRLAHHGRRAPSSDERALWSQRLAALDSLDLTIA